RIELLATSPLAVRVFSPNRPRVPSFPVKRTTELPMSAEMWRRMLPVTVKEPRNFAVRSKPSMRAAVMDVDPVVATQVWPDPEGLPPNLTLPTPAAVIEPLKSPVVVTADRIPGVVTVEEMLSARTVDLSIAEPPRVIGE